MEERPNLRRRPDDLMWRIVILSGLMVCLVLGLCNAPKSLYVQPVTEALGISRSAYSITDSCRFAATAVMNLFFGVLVARFGPRKLIAAGFVCAVAALVLFSVAENVWVFYAGGVLLGLIETFCKAYLSTQFSDAIVFLVLIIVLLVKPAGLLGKQVQEKV